MHRLQIWLEFLRAIYQAWISERPGQKAAALAYFGIFSVAPIIFIGYTLAILLIKQVATYSQRFVRLETAIGLESARWLRDSVITLGENTFGGSTLVSIVSFFALLFAASGIFMQIQFALNSTFIAPAASHHQTRSFVIQRLFSFLMALGGGLLAILATTLNVAVAWLGSLFGDLTGAVTALTILDMLVLWGLITLAFAIIYMILPNIEITWREYGREPCSPACLRS